MASIYQRGPVWWGKAQKKGRTYRRSLHTGDEEKARLRLGAWLKQLDAELNGRGLGEHTVREAADRFVDEHMTTLKPRAAERYFASMRYVMTHFGEMRLADVSKREMYAFEQWRRKMNSRAGKKISPVTIKRDLALLSSIFSCAEVWEWVAANPVKAYLRGRRQQGQIVESDPRNRFLDHTEERKLLLYAPDTVREAIMFAIDTGLRAEEQWGLIRSDIDLIRRRVTVRAANAKNGRERTVPLLDRAYEIVRRRLAFNTPTDWVFSRNSDGDRMEHTHAYRELQKGVEAASIPAMQWHDLRRTCGCRLLQDHKMDIARVSKWLGHSSVKVTEKHYAFLYIDDLELAVKRNVVHRSL